MSDYQNCWLSPGQASRRLILVIGPLLAATAGRSGALLTMVLRGQALGMPRAFFGTRVNDNAGMPERWPTIGSGSSRLWDICRLSADG